MLVQSLAGSNNLGELVELFGSHFADFADFFTENEVVGGFSDVLVVLLEHVFECGCAVGDDLRISFFGFCGLLASCHVHHIFSRPLADRKQAHYISTEIRLSGAIQFCQTFSWKRNSLNLNTPFEFLLTVLQSMVCLIAFSSSSSRTYWCRCACAGLFLYDFNPLRTEVQAKERRVATSCIDLNYFYQLHFILIRAMDKSNSNSEQSNLFVISSQSSRSETRQHRKENYLRFAKKVRDLLDVSGNDLDQLYQKVENIVVRYFQEHRVVDFEEMYAHIASLKSNSLKIHDIVNVLQKRLTKSSNSRYEQGRRSSKTQQFQTTLNSHKQRNSLHYESVEGNKEDMLNIFNEKEAQSSNKQNIVFKPSIVKENGHEMTPKVNRSKKQSEGTPSNYSPSRLSPSKTNIEQYYNRNRKYEQKIKEILKEVNAIKQSIPKKQVTNNEQSNLRINLRQNGYIQAEADPKSSINHIKQLIIGSNNDKVIESSQVQQNKTPNSSGIHELTTITTKQYEAELKGSQMKHDDKINEQIKAHNNQRQMNLSLMLKSSEMIAKQIRQAKEVASRLQISSREIQSNKQSETQILPPEKINNLIKKMSEGKKKQPILEEIQNTTSQVKISENMIPSFKNLPNQSQNATKQRQIFTTQLNIATVKTPIHVSANPSNLLSSSQVVNSFKPAAEQPPYNLSTIKYVYNPYPNSVVQPNHSLYVRPEPARITPIVQPAPAPIHRFQSRQRQMINKAPSNQIYINQVSSPISSSNSSTSIMRPHLFSRERENSSQTGRLQAQKSYVNQLQKSSINPIYSYPSMKVSGQSVQSSLNSNSSTSSLHRRGLNVTSHMEKKA